MPTASVATLPLPPRPATGRRAPRAAALLLLLLLLAANLAAAAAGRAVPPDELHDTGLYSAGSATELRPGIVPFSPQYPLWSDGATKRRWLRLPPGQAIDGTRPDAWAFPPGTQLWKEFALAGRRIETRYIERRADGQWLYATYLWNADGSRARLAPAAGVPGLPVQDAPDGRYEVPSRDDCQACHEGAAVPVLGLGALQLSPARDPLAPHATPAAASDIDLPGLVDRGWLRHLPPALIRQPPRIAAASATERAALGYLHANCGHCHNDSGNPAPVALRLAQRVTAAEDSAQQVLRSLLLQPARYRLPDRLPGQPAALPPVVPGQPAASALLQRMHSRQPQAQMPPLGTRIADEQGLALIERWIRHDLPARKETPP